MKKRMITLLLAASMVMMMSVAEASETTKQISITDQDIQILVNNNAISLQANEEPIIYDGRTFVPIRLVSEALGLGVEWVQASKTVKITGNTNTSTDALLQKDAEIQNLKLQIDSLNNTIETLKADDNELSDLEDDLVSDYDYLEDVKIDDITLEGDEDDVNVTIEVNLDDYEDEWADLDDSDIEDYIEDVVYSIQDQLSDDTEVEGEIIDNDSDDVLVEFNKYGDDSLEVTFEDDDYRDGSSDSDVEDVEDSLEGDNFYVGDLTFTITDVSYDDDDEAVTATLETVDDDAASEWDDLSSSTMESDVTDICEDIADTFEDDADVSVDTVTVYFYDENQDSLESFDYYVDDGDLV
ncbi:copper amine oxidase N-terminal domain-containing protein [Desulforamulus ruminis]|uniref:Copper amine oxidase-like domain-containing protein n=1 Tax=Desulforamulus ruminis (strain ATCC 23193 / DSM 2154 / NCIMB 8452 / DL) TaxID=696281 RepID=F6DTN2_DESRL|nr:copper amine oxidase N-terminal domain-containing protein [Desulforamulus ruminis]AEG61206.1 copper amine oxidase-like domain-containing protein [Desulforamulus ruminis DSM 2154]